MRVRVRVRVRLGYGLRLGLDVRGFRVRGITLTHSIAGDLYIRNIGCLFPVKIKVFVVPFDVA